MIKHSMGPPPNFSRFSGARLALCLDAGRLVTRYLAAEYILVGERDETSCQVDMINFLMQVVKLCLKG
jgi:hypothetical protein